MSKAVNHFRVNKGWWKLAQTQLPTIQLSDEEKKIFDFIRQARDRFARGISLRVAGGWVRDKVMGKQSDDIDIAVSGGSGLKLSEAVEQLNNIVGGGIAGNSYAVSLEKGGKSSGLMVGAIEIYGTKVEFVPMRTESYSYDSRVPVVAPTDDHSEDALRRDLTINAMYYNLDTNEIEDPSGGMEDLKSKVLRTPSNPMQTLTEDPLRAIRALRFMSKLNGFRIDKRLIDAISDPAVHGAWKTKIAPERVRKELEGIAKGNNPSEAFRILLNSGLYKVIFNSDRMSNFHPITMSQNNPHHDFNLLDHTISVVKNINDLMKKEGYGERERMVAVLAALFHDFGKMDPTVHQPSKSIPGATSYPGHENVSADIAEEVLKRLGFGQERFLVQAIVREHMRPHGSLDTPKSMNRFMRDFDSIKMEDEAKDKLWHITMLHGIADDMSKGENAKEEDGRDKFDKIRHMQTLRSSSVVSIKPMLSGGEIMEMFPNLDPKTGFIKQMSNFLLEAQDSGDIKDKDSARKLLIQNFGSMA